LLGNSARNGDLRSGQWSGQETAPDDVRYLGEVRIEYPLHRLFGQRFRVVRRARYAGQWFYVIDLGKQREAVPEWMTDPVACSNLTWGPDPVCSLDSLLELLRLLESPFDSRAGRTGKGR